MALHLPASLACMGPSRIVAILLHVGPLKGVKARLFLFGGLIAIALVDAWPSRSEEQALIDVGHWLCEASIIDTPINPGRPRRREASPSRLTGLTEGLRVRMKDRCFNFSERCDVRVVRGRMLITDDSDYLLTLSDGDGGWTMLIIEAHGFYSAYTFEVEAVGGGGWGSGPC